MQNPVQLTLYHGFSRDTEGFSAPVYFAFDKKLANNYARLGENRTAVCNVSLLNPLVLENPQDFETRWKDASTGFSFDGDDDDRVASVANLQSFAAYARDQGHDGVVLRVESPLFDVTFGDSMVIVFDVQSIEVLEYSERNGIASVDDLSLAKTEN